MKMSTILDEWNSTIDNTDSIMGAIEKLTDENAAILTLVYEYGREGRYLERLMREAGCKSDDEMTAMAVDQYQESKKLRAVKEDEYKL